MANSSTSTMYPCERLDKSFGDECRWQRWPEKEEVGTGASKTREID